jgi:hypothetical protein
MRMAEISDSMGTLIEDMVAPCGFQIARAIFSSEEAETFAMGDKVDTAPFLTTGFPSSFEGQTPRLSNRV